MIVSWYLRQAKDHGFLKASKWLWRVTWATGTVLLSNKLLPSRLECPCCGWKGRRFLDYIEVGYTVPNAACPNCDSHSRHRALYLWLKHEFQLESKMGNALIFAPERALAPIWSAAHNLKVYRADIEPHRRVDLLLNIMRLPFSAESVDLIWCHHVLEQVEDDRVALRELHRVLKSTGGELIVSVGIGGQQTTLEFGRADKSQSGNRRQYGADFVNRLSEAGFIPKSMVYNLTVQECERYGINPEPFYYCRKAVA